MGIGEVLWDCFPDRRTAGGAPLNVVHHAHELGADGYLLSAVGKDAPGKDLLNCIEKLGINALITENEYPTGTACITVSGENILHYAFPAPAAWDDTRTDCFQKEADDMDAVCFGTLAQRDAACGSRIRRLIGNLNRNILKVLDLNLRNGFYTAETLTSSMELCHVLKFNDAEAAVLQKTFDLKGDLPEIGNALLEQYGLKMVAVTCGTRGSYLFTPHKHSYLGAPKVKVKDTVGAGDAFTAAMVMGMLNGLSLKELHNEAVALSAFTCTCRGATPPHHRDVIGLIMSNLTD